MPKLNFFLFSVFFVGSLISAIDLSAQTGSDAASEDESSQDIPDGFEYQELELGGRILKPVNWKFESRAMGKTLVYKIWEPLPDDKPGWDTGITINIVSNVTEATGLTPSRYAEDHIKNLKDQGKVVARHDPETYDDMIRSGIVLDQKMTITGSEKEYRVRYALFADDDRGLLTVINFGTLVDQWDKYSPTFDVMTKRFQLLGIDRNKKDKSNNKKK